MAPDLADSPAAAWAFSLAFPAELKPLFVDCFGVREVGEISWGWVATGIAVMAVMMFFLLLFSGCQDAL